MNSPVQNHHATALVVGCRGFLFVGPSGSGKTRLALACLAEAETGGMHTAIVGDDQVFLRQAGGSIIAEAPPAISGLAEVRGGGIVSVPSQAAAVMDFAVLPVSFGASERQPPENETYAVLGGLFLQLLRLPVEAARPLDLLLRLAAAWHVN